MQQKRNDLLIRRIALTFALVCLACCATTETSPPPIYKPADYGYGLSAVAISDNGRLAAVANFNTIWILDLQSMTRVLSFSRKFRYGTNNTLTFIGNELVASTGRTDLPDVKDAQAAITIWNIKDQFSEPTVLALPELGRFAISLARSPATGALAVGGENGAVVLLEPDSQNGFRRKLLPGLGGAVLDVLFSLDGRLLAAGGVNPEVVIWDTQSLQEFARLPVDGTIYALELVPGRKSLIAVGDQIRLWKFLTDEELESFGNPSMAGDVITVGVVVAALVVVFAATTGAPTFGGGGPPQPAYGFCKRLAAVSPDGQFLVDVHPGITKEKIRIIDIDQHKVVKTINPRGGRTCGVAFTPDGKSLIVANNRVARRYDTTTWKSDDFPLK